VAAAGAFVGVDVAKAALEVAVRPGGDAWSAANDPALIAAVVGRVRAAGPALVVLEATGGADMPLAAALAAVGLPVAVVNPRQVGDFARAVGQLATTDALDAHVLARFAEAVRPPVRPVPDAQARELEAVLARRHHLVQMRPPRSSGWARRPRPCASASARMWLGSTPS
jgi:transposase